MKSREQRRSQTHEKFLSRVKMWFQIEGRLSCKTWDEYLKKNKWLHLLKHNKTYGRSTMNNMEKKKSNKRERVESKKIINGID